MRARSIGTVRGTVRGSATGGRKATHTVRARASQVREEPGDDQDDPREGPRVHDARGGHRRWAQR
eukprot:7382474-Prymnesium_polylepis.3